MNAPSTLTTTLSIDLTQRLARVVANLHDAVLCLNRSWYITYANAEAIRISRLDPGQFALKTHWEMFPDTVGTELERRYVAALESGKPDQFEYFYEPFHISLNIHILPTDDGIALYYQDVSVRREAEAREAATTRRIRQVFDATPDGIVLIDHNWRFTFANQAALRLVGLDDILGHDIFDLFPGNNEEPFNTAYRTTMKTREPTEFEAYHSAPLNLWLKVQAKPYDEGIIVFFSDISARKLAEIREQEASRRLEQVLDATSDAVISMDRQWCYTYLNGNAKRLIDPEGRLLGRNMWEEFPLTVSTPAWDIYHRSMNQGLTGTTEVYYGDPLNAWFSLRSEPAPDGIVVFFRDVTEQRTHDLLVKEQHDVLAAVQSAVLLATWNIELATGKVTYGTASYPVYGHPLENVATRESFYDIIHPDQRKTLAESVQRAIETGERFVEDLQVIAADGSVLWIEARGQAVYDAAGVATNLRGMGIDISARKKNEASLLASETRYRVLADLNPQAIWMGDANGDVTYANQRFLAYLGLTPDNLSGVGWLEAFLPEDQARMVEVWTRSVTTGVDYDIEVRLRNVVTGQFRWWHLRAAPVRDSAGGILHWLGVAGDIHDAKTYAETLRAEQIETERRRAELETIYKTSPVGLALLDPVEFRFLNLNDREAEMLGYPKDYIIGRALTEIAPLESVPGLMEMMRSVAQGAVIKERLLEGALAARPNEMRAWSVNYSPIYNEDGSIRAISTASIEITNQKKAEAALVQSEKLAAVGRLASSISHEINNPLEAITNLLYLIAMDEKLPAEMKTYVHMAQSELSRVSQIATQTLRFHRQAVAPTLVTPEDLVGAVVRLYTGRLANSHIKVEAQYQATSPILCFENDIRQVLNNLIANAIDAMRTGGRLIIRAHECHDQNPKLIQPRPGVRITIADTGHGMSKDVLSRVFEPFFTTKDLNGTGLGLWISAGIVDRHQGRLCVRSSEHTVHHGTIFTLFLPREEVATL